MIGSNVFDFISAPTPGAGEAPGSNEYMLFLQTWGTQLPLGYEYGVKKTFNLYGTTWNLYQGRNQAHGQMVNSLVPTEPFIGVFQGDLKEWLDALASEGIGGSDDFLNVGNAGTEIFYGSSKQNGTISLKINLK